MLAIADCKELVVGSCIVIPSSCNYQMFCCACDYVHDRLSDYYKN